MRGVWVLVLVAGAAAAGAAYYIDERFNGGGFIPDFFMNILRQKLVNLWKPRYGQDWRTPGTAFLGHMAMISNGYAGSGGDALPYYFQYYELGEVIGTRTWGGLVGISGYPSLMDGGYVTAASFGIMDLEGNWIVENKGVTPDNEVIEYPADLIAGRDPQLERRLRLPDPAHAMMDSSGSQPLLGDDKAVALCAQ